MRTAKPGDDRFRDGTAGADAAMERAASMIASARAMLVFTGAGISAESGVPTFRGSGGLYESLDERHLEIGYFRTRPAESWETLKKVFYSFPADPEPNPAHLAIARWERTGRVLLVVTQNIDGLHGKAGSRRIAEYHGSLERVRCERCGAFSPREELRLERLPPRCACGGVLRPDIVFFGEPIPEAAIAAASEASASCDLCVISGSTGMVWPAAGVPFAAARRGVPVIEVNPEPSEFTSRIASVFVRAPAGEAFARMDAMVAALDRGA